MKSSATQCTARSCEKYEIGSRCCTPSSSLGVERNQNRNFVQEPTFLFWPQDCGKYWQTGYKCQEESKKIFTHVFILESESEIAASQTGMSIFPAVLRRKQEFGFLHKALVLVLLNPYSSPMSWNKSLIGLISHSTLAFS